jgi:hypothetical protein
MPDQFDSLYLLTYVEEVPGGVVDVLQEQFGVSHVSDGARFVVDLTIQVSEDILTGEFNINVRVSVLDNLNSHCM